VSGYPYPADDFSMIVPCLFILVSSYSSVFTSSVLYVPIAPFDLYRGYP
jgi:hypothetical protein